MYQKFRRITRSKGLPKKDLPTVKKSGYEVPLKEIYQRLVLQYYPKEELKWDIKWGENMNANSAVTCIRKRVILISKYVYKRLYAKFISENKSAYKAHKLYKQDLEETILHEIIHVYLYLEHGKAFPEYKDNINHGKCFLAEMKRLNGLLENGYSISVDHPAADKIIKRYKYYCTTCKIKITRSKKFKPTDLNDWYSDVNRRCCGKPRYVRKC